MNAEIGYTQENGQLNSLTIPKNPYPGKINVYVVKPDVNPIIESKYDTKNVLTNGEIMCKSSIDVDLILNITDIESLQYSLVKDQPQNMNGSFIKDNYRVLNKISTQSGEKINLDGLDIDILGLTRFSKEKNINGSIMIGGMEIKYLTIELTLEVNVNENIEIEKVGVI